MFKFQNFFKKADNPSNIKSPGDFEHPLSYEALTADILFNTYPDPIIIFNNEGRIISMNHAITDLVGKIPDNIRQFLKQVKPPKNIQQSLECFQKALQGQKQIFNSVFIKKDGHIMEVNVALIPIPSPQESVEGVLGIVRDITELRKKSETLSKMELSIHNAEKLVSIGAWDYDVIEDEAFWSDHMYGIFGIERDEVPSYESFFRLIHPDDQDHFLEKYNEAINNKDNFHVKYRIIRPDGEERIMNQQASVSLDENLNVVRIIGITVDITEQEMIQEKLAENQEQLKTISSILDAGIWSADPRTNKVLFCSRGIESICGYPSHAFEEGKILWENLIFPEDLKGYKVRQEQLKRGKVPRYPYRIVHKNGEIIWVQDEIIPTFDRKGNLVRLDGIITDITEQKKSEEQLAYLAYHDYLTDLPNRRMFELELDSLIEKALLYHTEFALIYIDMDGFKRINDTLGHLIGDKLLIEIASRFRDCLSSHDFLARMGGDEFTALIRNMKDIEQPVMAAKEMINKIEEPYFINDYEIYITASIGIATYPNDGDDAQTLLKRADTALFRAKEMGKNNYQIYNSSMNIESYKLYTLDRDLRKAINNNEFVMHYQPKVDAKSGKMIGAEALIRWEHPKWGLVSPNEFISLAEQTNLIFRITDWSFRAVCEQIKEWEKMNLPLVPVSVNISPKRFLKNDWLEMFLGIVKELDIDPKLLELEIVESAIISNEEAFLSSIEKLKEAGIKLSLDDFGTGYSSLLYLKKFKVDTVKIDRGFIKDAFDSNDPIIKSIIYLSHGLNMNVVAEGVETEEQLAFLRQLECDQIQGYLFSKPVPVKEFENMLLHPLLRAGKGEARKPSVERRRVFRVEFTFPLSAKMTIINVKGKQVKLGKTEVLVEDMGMGGLKFFTHINLPVNPEILIEFETTILNERIFLQGHIVWKQEANDFWHYGLQFTLSEAEETNLTVLLNKLAIKLRKNPIPADCPFIKESKEAYLNRMRL